MSDIFVSYASEDREKAAVLAKAIEELGWSVWWDRNIPTGRLYADVIKEQLDMAKCVLVLWSQKSVSSNWVRTEANAGKEKLFPVLIDQVAPPLEFSLVQACDLVLWDGRSEDERFQKLVTDLRGLLGSPMRAVELAPKAEHQATTQTARSDERMQAENETRPLVRKLGLHQKSNGRPMIDEVEVMGLVAEAPFTLKLHRGSGMIILAMNWKGGVPPQNFVGFAIEYREPGGNVFFPLANRLSFLRPAGSLDANALSTRLSPIQKFRWLHYPVNANLPGDFFYKVTPVFMGSSSQLTYGVAQDAVIQLSHETYPKQVNVTFTRGFVSGRAFVDRYASAGPMSKLLPAKASKGLDFVPTHPKVAEALEWMGFEARSEILEVLDQAIIDKKADVCVVAYELNEPSVVSRLEKLKRRLRIIIDDSEDHGELDSAETKAARRLSASAGADNVQRQHMLNRQHNTTIVVSGPTVQAVVCGSTNFSWRGFFVQSNSAVILRGASAVKPFLDAFENYWSLNSESFRGTTSAMWSDLGLRGIDARVTFSPHGASNALLKTIADDVETKTTSSLLYSLPFLTVGPMLDAIQKVSNNRAIFAYGVSERADGGLDLRTPDGRVSSILPSALAENAPQLFSQEPTAGGGIRMHHKFLIIDFDKPTARVYFGSYNFSPPADMENGENLLLIRDRRIVTAYVVEAMRIFEHYHFRVSQDVAKKAINTLVLAEPPRRSGEKPWWNEYYTNAWKIRDRELFA